MSDATPARFVALAPLAGGGSWLGYERGAGGALWPVAIIRVPAELLEDPDRMEQLREDTARAAQIDHPNVLRVLGCEPVEGGFARIVEFGDGESLRRLLEAARRSGRPLLPPRLITRLVADACAGVQHVHDRGQAEGHVRGRLHGALKPETLLIGFDGIAKVTGYGALAVAPRDAFGARLSPRFQYLSPEEIERGAAATDRRSDVYALGVILYEALCGHPPFSTTDPEFERKVMTQDPPAEPLARSPALLRELALQALSKSPNERFSSAGQFAQALTALGVSTHEEAGIELDRLFPAEGDARLTHRQLLAAAGIAGPPWPRPPAMRREERRRPPPPPAPDPPPDLPIESSEPIPAVAAPPAPQLSAPAQVAAPRAPSVERPPRAPRRGSGSSLAVFLSGALLAGGGVAAAFLYHPLGRTLRAEPPPRLAAPAPAPVAPPSPPEVAPADLAPLAVPLANAARPKRRGRPRPAKPKALEPEPAHAGTSQGLAGMEITAPPGSHLFLDGRAVGTAPAPTLHFPAGTHTIRVTMGKAVFERRFFADGDETLTLDVHPGEAP